MLPTPATAEVEQAAPSVQAARDRVERAAAKMARTIVAKGRAAGLTAP